MLISLNCEDDDSDEIVLAHTHFILSTKMDIKPLTGDMFYDSGDEFEFKVSSVGYEIDKGGVSMLVFLDENHEYYCSNKNDNLKKIRKNHKKRMSELIRNMKILGFKLDRATTYKSFKGGYGVFGRVKIVNHKDI